MAERRSTKPEEKCACYQAQAFEELLRGVEVVIGACINDGSDSALQIAANLNLLAQGAKAMAEVD